MRLRAAALGIAGSVLFLALLLWRSEPGEVRTALADAEVGWVLLSVAVYAPALWLRAERWRTLAGAAVPLQRGAATRLVAAGYAVNNVLPVRVGEVVRAELAHRRSGADRLLVLGTILAERLLDGALLALLLTGTLALAGADPRLRTLAAVATTLGLVAVAALLWLSRAGEHRRATLSGWLPGPAAGWAARLLAGLATVPDARTWLRVWALTLGSWLVEAAMYALVGRALGLDLDWPLYLAVAGAANLAITVPSSAGGVGPFEFFARETVVHFGVPTALGTAYALVLHAALLVPVALVGLPLLWLEWRRDPTGAGTPGDGEAGACG